MSKRSVISHVRKSFLSGLLVAFCFLNENVKDSRAKMLRQRTNEYDKYVTSILTNVIYRKPPKQVHQVLLDEDIPVNRVYKVSEARGYSFTYFNKGRIQRSVMIEGA